MDVERKRIFIINTLYYAMIGFLIYFGFKYAIRWLFPFIIAFIIVAIIQSVTTPIKKILQTKNEKISIAVLLVVYLLIVGVLIYLVFNIWITFLNLIRNLPTLMSNYVLPTMETLFGIIEKTIHNIDPTLTGLLGDFKSQFSSIAMSFATSLSKNSIPIISGFASSIPGVFIGVLITVISSFFIAIDYKRINEFIIAQCSPKVKTFVLEVIDYTINTLFKIVFAYVKIMSITFVELSIGFLILGIQSPLLIALMISIFDILPVLGTGGIMIPWMIYLLINHQSHLAIGLLIIYIIVTIVRNIIEPKIVGNQIGIHPLLMLISMYAGVKIFGIIGLFLIPIMMIIIKNLNDSGKIHLYKNIS